MEQYMDDNKKLAKETLRELKAAKERYTKDGDNCPVELDHRIKMYTGGFVKEPRDFDSEIRHITTALIIEENDYKYDPAIGKFVNGRDETALMKDAVKENDLNDKKRKELGYKIPEYRKKDRLAAVNIALGRPPEYVEPKPEAKKPDLIQLELPFPKSDQPKQGPIKEKKESFFDGRGIANYDVYILNKAKFGKVEDL
jgi:hypothetical protein